MNSEGLNSKSYLKHAAEYAQRAFVEGSGCADTFTPVGSDASIDGFAPGHEIQPAVPKKPRRTPIAVKAMRPSAIFK